MENGQIGERNTYPRSRDPRSSRRVKYEVAGMYVVRHWFGYRQTQPPSSRRRRHPDGSPMNPLNEIHADHWAQEQTTGLLNLVQVLQRLVDLERDQVALLRNIIATEQITVSDLEAAGVLPPPAASRKAIQRASQHDSVETPLFERRLSRLS